MIDLNDVFVPAARHNLTAIKARLAATARDWLPPLFPEAQLTHDKRAMRCADLSGRRSRGEGSCVIHLDGPYAGWGFDFATGERAGPIDMIYHATGMSEGRLFDEAARLARIERDLPVRPAAPARPDHSLEIRRILDGCEPLAGSLTETYLQSRGLRDPGSPDLLFHPDLTDYDSRRGWPGMVAIPRLANGDPVGGIHRTFLLDDGSGKAPAGKKMLGTIAEAAVRLFPLPEDGHLGVAEGIETALAAAAIFGKPVWAALSADGMARFKWPEGTRRVTIFADAGEVGRQAAATLSDRLNMADIPNEVMAPLHGDDFNDDLLRGAVKTDYGSQITTPEGKLLRDDSGVTKPATDLEPAADALATATEGLTNPPDLAELGTLMGRIVKARLEPMEERHVLSLIKARTGIAMSILDKQLGVLRRRLNSTGDLMKPAARPAWANRLRLDLSGTPERNEANVIIALSSDPAFAGTIAFDEFRQEVVVLQPVPWDEQNTDYPRPWEDSDDIRLAEWLQHREVNVAPLVVGRSVGAVARDYRIHPVRAYLDHLQWDGTRRLETWPSRYLGAAPTELTHAMGSLWLISAIARVYRPGVKADHMLILEGEQGARKSTALKILAGEDWFTDELPDLGSKDAAIHMQGVWIVEIAELDAIGRAEVSRIKAFLTRTTDRFRPPYGRHTVEIKRQCVFAGTVNPDTYLRDETGNRRFWPIRCGDIDIDALARDRDQLWAEAVARFKDGAIWWIEDKAILQAAREEQDKRYQSDAWDGLIEHWLTHELRVVGDSYSSFDPPRRESVLRHEPLRDVSVGEILEEAIGAEPARWSRTDQMRVSGYLKKKGWERYQRREGGEREWRYRRPNE
ncbi:Predicted P-loop ATPase and inactivated derivatives [Thalassovita litoralis]|uniref:Predicted P-loop ATPase and inactivated derivatives n=1 Tax=Thalassovita litoralis TaxID=1010611 RepID=A0A521CYG4_9RHOB|nr:VapE domain-containing protein [Thalassovita litoralis]SMO64452.1 Predicted P-loop ATPase and inactivated derivatives [Thalassovita litoralis]